MREDGDRRLLDLGTVNDIYADGIGAVEILGDCVRVSFFAYRTAARRAGGWQREKVIVAKVVRPLSSAGQLEPMIQVQLSALTGPRSAQ
jgi:hypothetical protein